MIQLPLAVLLRPGTLPDTTPDSPAGATWRYLAVNTVNPIGESELSAHTAACLYQHSGGDWGGEILAGTHANRILPDGGPEVDTSREGIMRHIEALLGKDGYQFVDRDFDILAPRTHAPQGRDQGGLIFLYEDPGPAGEVGYRPYSTIPKSAEEREAAYQQIAGANPEMGSKEFREKVKKEVERRGIDALMAARYANPETFSEATGAEISAMGQAAIAGTLQDAINSGTLQDAINSVKLREQTDPQDLAATSSGPVFYGLMLPILDKMAMHLRTQASDAYIKRLDSVAGLYRDAVYTMELLIKKIKNLPGMD